MAETALNATNLDLNQPDYTDAAAFSSQTPQACDASNGNSFANGGVELLIATNTGASTRTIQFRDINNANIGAAFSLAAGKECVFGPFNDDHFGSTVRFTASHAEVVVRVVSLHRHQQVLTD